jgi:RHS repeat-associated protein
MPGYSTGSDNRLTCDGTYTYTYNAEGDLTQKVSTSATWTYGWDNLNRLVGVKQVTATGTQLSVSYAYDVLNNRVEDDTWKPGTGTVTVRHAYDDRGGMWADVTTTNTLLTRYVYGDGVSQVWARAVPAGQPNSGVAWYLTDRRGSVRDIMDSSSVIQDHVDYGGYGDATHTTLSVADQFGYAGGLYSCDTKMEQFGARWYDAATGRWVSEDPSGFGGVDGNLYRYVHNRATDSTDPSGMIELAPIQTVAGPYTGVKGAFAWGVVFSLKDPTKTGGFILQHVVIRAEARSGLGVEENPDKRLKIFDALDYWEAFPVPAEDTTKGIDGKHSPGNLFSNAVGFGTKIPTDFGFISSGGFIDDLWWKDGKVAKPAVKATELERTFATDWFFLQRYPELGWKGRSAFNGQVYYFDCLTSNQLRAMGFTVGTTAKGKVSPAGLLLWQPNSAVVTGALMALKPTGPLNHTLEVWWDWTGKKENSWTKVVGQNPKP